MCGILAVIGKADLERTLELSALQSHRGPDERDYHQFEDGSILCHERLAIIDLNTGKQPIQGSKDAYIIHNGEIYNHESLKKDYFKDVTFRTKSDSEIILRMYEVFGKDCIDQLDGVFAFVIKDGDGFLAARDAIGVKSMYYGKDAYGNWYFSSEMKSIAPQCEWVKAFPPGHYLSEKDAEPQQWFTPEWLDHTKAKKEKDLELIRTSLIDATEKRLMSDVPLGVLLSGGLDSSLTSSIAARALRKKGIQLHSFSIGLDKSAPDLKAARKVAEFIGTVHHEVHFTVAQGLEVLDKLIYHLETYDVTSVRASTPMYLLSEYIKKQGISVVLSGEGADEILGGYLYFSNAPSLEEFQKETIRRVQKLSTADCLRADKSTMAHGIEARVPFLDKHFLKTAILVDPVYKKGDQSRGILEKHILREAFDTKKDPYLPEEVLWRQKEQFSDGVGYSWIDELKKHCESQVTDEEMSRAAELFPINTPTSKEALFYRKIFAKHFPGESTAQTVKKWIPKWQSNTDPSGRASELHEKSYQAI